MLCFLFYVCANMLAIEAANENDVRSIDKKFPWHIWFSPIKMALDQ